MKHYGFIKPKIESDHYILGAYNSLPRDILQRNGQWDSYLPSEERQTNQLTETYNCTSFGSLNCIEILFRKLYGLEENYSDRYLGIMADTKPYGNDPHVVVEALRNKGLIKESTLPFTEDLNGWQEYYSFKGGSESDCKVEAIYLANKYEIGHEWVISNGASKEIRTSLMKQALQYSPLGVSVSAWNELEGVYIDAGQPNNHWTVVYGYNEKGWKCFDSYEPYKKIISFDHNIEYVKRFSLKKKEEIKQTWWQMFISNLLRYFHR